jgi:poly(3-hydroxybutyrate) depolymerase
MWLVGQSTAARAEDVASPDAAADGVRLTMGPDGLVGAWLVAGPFPPSHVPAVSPEPPRLGAPIGNRLWTLAYAADGPVDLKTSLQAHEGECVAYAAAVVHVDHPGHHVLLLGADDGIEVSVDGITVFVRDESRPQRDDDDLVGVNLDAGDHRLLLTLHQHGGPWGLRARWLDGELSPPLGGWWQLAGASDTDAHALAGGLARVWLDRGMRAEDYVPRLHVRYPEGAPLGVELSVRARLQRSGSAEPVFDLSVGEVARSERGATDFAVDLPGVPGAVLEEGDFVLHVEVAGRPIDIPIAVRRPVREAVARAMAALSRVGTAVLSSGSAESVEYLRDRLVAFVEAGSTDAEADLRDARELDTVAAALEVESDPYEGRTGPMRRAYRSPADGHLSEFGLYVPPGWDKKRRLPLVVALHGMNGRPMQMLSWLFGHDDGRDSAWQDRHPYTNFERLDAVVVTPDGHGNAGYRELGEDDVMRVIDWAESVYPIDNSRITITGPSMGGIGAAGCALRHPDRFAASAPLCGYHSYFLRGDMMGRPLQPWERFLAEERSNVLWAENGAYLPLFLVHGTLDLPLENTTVLADRYDELRYDEVHDYPDLGHNVWQTTYADLQGAKWLVDHRRPAHPRSIRFKTSNPRWSEDDWVHIVALGRSDAWGEVSARVEHPNAIAVSSQGVRALVLDRDARLIDDSRPVAVTIDRTRLVFQAGEPIAMHREEDGWHAGALRAAVVKQGTVNGPIRDVFHDPLLFVWGDDDPTQARANEETARAWSRMRPGVRVSYPVMSDREFLALGEGIQGDRSLFLVGNARSNRIVRELEPHFPIRIDGSDVVLVRSSDDTEGSMLERIPSLASGELEGGREAPHSSIAELEGGREAPHSSLSWTSQLGTMFIVPNPLRPTRYVVVVEGVGAFGTWRSLSLPDLLPDYVVFDDGIAPARGSSVLGSGRLRIGGYFTNDWRIPAH